MAHPFDDITLEQLRATGGLKWSQHPDAIGAVRRGDGLRHRAADPGGDARLRRRRPVRLPPRRAGRVGCRRRGRGFARTRYGWDVPPERVRPLADVVAGLQAAIEHFSAPGAAGDPADAGVHAVPHRPAGAGPRGHRGADGAARAAAPSTTSTRSTRRTTRAATCWCSATRTTRSAGCWSARRCWRRRGRRAARRAGVLRRDPRSPGVRRPPPRALRDGLRRDRRAHRHRGVGVEGVEPARAQVRAAGAVQRRRRREVGAGRVHGRARRRPTSASSPTSRPTRRAGRGWPTCWPTSTATAGCSATCSPSDLPEVRYHAARGHLPGLAGLPRARPRRPPGGVLPRARRAWR